MEYFSQSPELRHNGTKLQSPYGWGKAIRTHELEAAINCCLGQKDFAMAKIMYFLTGNAEGFKVSEKTILERCNISESGYKKARKKLVQKQWIFHQAGEYIQVNFNKIFNDFKDYKAGCYQGNPQNDSLETEGLVSVETLEIVSNPSEVSTVQLIDIPEEPSGRSPEESHNNINNNIKNNIEKISENSITVRCEGTRSEVANATSPQAPSQPLRERIHTKEEMDKVEREFSVWFGTEERKVRSKFSGVKNDEDLRRMHRSDEYNDFLKRVDARREALKQEYGQNLKI